MYFSSDRRGALVSLGAGLMMSGLAQAGAATTALEPTGAKHLRDFTRQLAGISRRRDFKTVPMILDKPELWDSAALDAVMAYKSGPKQAWDHTDLTGSWLNGMRNTLNTQVFAFKEPNFLCVSGTHGPAHLALYDQDTWDKYQLAKIAGGNIRSNTFIVLPDAAAHDQSDFQSTEGAFSPKGNNIAVLQRRGVVFLACHNAIWELADKLIAAEQNPDNLAIDALAADLTNHLIRHVVLTPGVVATLVKLETSGFVYTR
jgi:intracellular sulfur oxidation DsrE/DsrF family protein